MDCLLQLSHLLVDSLRVQLREHTTRKILTPFMPGHGGLVDRMDCQIVMIIFCYFHYQTFINTTNRIFHVEYIISLLSEMSLEDQEKIYQTLQVSLSKNGSNFTW